MHFNRVAIESFRIGICLRMEGRLQKVLHTQLSTCKVSLSQETCGQGEEARGEREKTYDEFLAALPASRPAFAIVNVPYKSKDVLWYK